MSIKVYVDIQKEYIQAVKVIDKSIEDYFAISNNNIINNVYIGRVENIKGKQCFVNFDEKRKNGILELKGKGYKSGDYIKCQVKREEFGEKGAILNEEITVPGFFCILSNKLKGYKFSRKLNKGFINTIKEYLPITEYGFIIRSNAMYVTKQQIISEINFLIETYNKISQIKENNKICCIYAENILLKVLKEININNHDIIINTDKELGLKFNKVTYYNGLLPILDYYGLTKEVESIFERKIEMKNQTEIVFDDTEAMTVIDVNSKGAIGGNIELINQIAAEEIIKQIRLRNISGLILIDFISSDKHNELVNFINKSLKNDREKAMATGLKELSLVAINRKKRYNNFKSIFYTKCFECGLGEVKKDEIVCRNVCEDILKLYNEKPFKNIKIRMNPYLYELFIKNEYITDLDNLKGKIKLHMEKDSTVKKYLLTILDDKEKANHSSEA